MSENQHEKNLKELSDAQLAKLIQDGDESAFNEIFKRYIRLIFSIASKYSAESFEKSDFVQEGLIGLLSACRTFDENAGASFKNYASLCVERRFISIIKKAYQLSFYHYLSSVEAHKKSGCRSIQFPAS